MTTDTDRLITTAAPWKFQTLVIPCRPLPAKLYIMNGYTHGNVCRNSCISHRWYFFLYSHMACCWSKQKFKKIHSKTINNGKHKTNSLHIPIYLFNHIHTYAQLTIWSSLYSSTCSLQNCIHSKSISQPISFDLLLIFSVLVPVQCWSRSPKFENVAGVKGLITPNGKRHACFIYIEMMMACIMYVIHTCCFQCFDIDGWVAGRASGQ